MMITTRTKPSGLAILLALACAAAAGADVLLMKDGRKVEGTVTEKNDAYDVLTKQGPLTVKKDDVKEVRKEPVPASQKAGGDSEKEASDLLDAADKLLAKKYYAEARSTLERLVRQYPKSGAADKARETLATMPTSLGRLVLGFDKPSDAQIVNVLSGGQSQAEPIADPKRVRQGTGAVHLTLGGAMQPTFVMFKIPEQNLEKLKTVSFWMYSEVKLHQKRVMKLCLVSPSSGEVPNFLDANIVGADENGWKLVQVNRGQFKGEGGGFAADVQNGRPDWKKIVGIGFLLPPEAARDFIIDDVRILE